MMVFLKGDKARTDHATTSREDDTARAAPAVATLEGDMAHAGPAVATLKDGTARAAPVAATLKDDTARAALAVASLFFVCGAGFSNWLARIPAVRAQLHLSDQTLGLVLLCAGIGAVVAFRVAGRLMARFGSRAVAIASSLAFCVLVPFPTLAFNTASIAVALFCVGASSGLMDVSMNVQAVEVEKRLGRAILSRFHGVFSLGGLIGAGTGALAAQASLPPAWHLVIVAVGCGALVAGAARFLVPATRAPPPRAWTRPSGAILVLGAVAFCSSVGEGAMADWTAVYLHDVLGTGMGVAGAGYACYSASMVAGRFSGDAISARLSPARIVRGSGLIVASGLSMGLLVNSPLAMIVGVMCVGAGLSLIIPVVFRAGAKIPNAQPGATLSTLATISYGGFLLGPPTIGFVAEHWDLRWGLAVVVALALLLTSLASAVERS